MGTSGLPGILGLRVVVVVIGRRAGFVTRPSYRLPIETGNFNVNGSIVEQH